ncbi:cupin domain-containing protein [Roseobacter ponti]|uniref:Cupin domain-containing protein n=1 Tax=Roseobacter ponti TaxID=1891787 RepID=A0A858T0E5_9RHOB|nr:cupin domain-containing protein [Roseobacter ponti]QJF53343.1 cupin domain-containing protein [Roseobacter ponti]
MDIGHRLRAIRKQRGLSQRELAARAGLTNGTISLIEKNRTSPSVASLKSLLDAIPISMAEFFATIEDQGQSKYFYKAGEFTEIAPTDDDAQLLSLRMLGGAHENALQLLHERYEPGADTGPEFLSHDAEEAGVVVRGQIEITVDEEISTLGPGDGYLFNSRLPHRFRNTGTEPCEIISACTPPSF